MNPSNEQKREIDALFHDAEPSSIPLQKPEPTPILPVTLVDQGTTLWSQESRGLLSDYEFGLSLGKFGENDLTTDKFFKRLREALIATVTRICNKENLSSEKFKLHFAIVDSILTLIAKEIENKKLSQYSVKTPIAVLHGFFESYINETISKKQRKGIEKW